MAPDLNSLPPSRSPSQHNSHANNSPETFRPLHAPSPVSQIGVQPSPNSPRHRSSPRVERRRSSLLGEWSLNDGHSISPATADPHHHRTPSLGELHQELENEQEAQVNRLLGLIRQQQAQIAQYQSALGTPGTTTAVEDTVPLSATSTSTSSNQIITAPASQPITGSAPSSRTSSTAPQHSLPLGQIQGTHALPQPSQQRPTSISLSRQSSSRRSSHAGSPALRPMSTTSSAGVPPVDGSDWFGAPHRDEVTLVQAETAMVQRENQMLKMRIRELERQLETFNMAGAGSSHATGGNGAATDGQSSQTAAANE